MTQVPLDPQPLNQFKTLIADRLKQQTPTIPAVGASQAQLLTYWFTTIEWFEQRHAELTQFTRRLFRHFSTTPPANLAFQPPDIIKIDALARLTADDLRQQIVKGVALMSSRLVMLLTESVFSPLHRDSTIGVFQDFGPGCRVLLPVDHGSFHVEADLLQTQPVSTWRLAWRTADLADVPPWFSPTIIRGECIRLMESTQRSLSMTRFHLTILRFGPYVLATSPDVCQLAARLPSTSRSYIPPRSLGRRIVRSAALMMAISGVIGLFAVGYTQIPVISGVVSLVVLIAVVLILLRSDNHAPQPGSP